MDNQKSNDGSARDLGREGAGSSMGKDLGSTSGSNMGKSAEALHQTIDKAADAAQPVVDRLASSAHTGVDKMQGALAGAGKTVDEKARQLSEAYGKFAESGRGYVRTSPMTSVLVAVGAGFILSKLFSSRR